MAFLCVIAAAVMHRFSEERKYELLIPYLFLFSFWLFLPLLLMVLQQQLCNKFLKSLSFNGVYRHSPVPTDNCICTAQLFLKVAEIRLLLIRRCCNLSTVLLGCQNINPFHDIFPQYAHYNMYECSDIIDKNTAFVGKYCCFLKLNPERKITENILIQDTQNFF